MIKNWTHFESMLKERNENWLKADEILYALCRDCKGHTSANDLNAKVLIIGRSYATGIERAIESEGGQASSLTKLTKHMLENGKDIDAIIDRLREIEEPLTPVKLQKIVYGHAQFIKVLDGLVRGVPHSFASKYLHFHAPAVPIYDSYACARLTALVKWNASLKEFDSDEKDGEYYWFVCRFWRLYQSVRQRYPATTVKELDYYLLCNPPSSA